MEANELRIGNKVMIFNNEATVVGSDFEKWFESGKCDYWKPIPLTEEWLQRFGFEKIIIDN